jgi:hypothetical protein
MLRRRERREWRPESGPEYDLRQYVGGHPTGLVAAMSWLPEGHGDHRQLVSGPNGLLIRERNRLVLLEHRGQGEAAVPMQIPLRSCLDVTLVDEPGLPGHGFVRFVLTGLFGAGATFTVTMRFPHEQRGVLAGIAREVNTADRQAQAANPAPVVRPLPLLDVRQAPDDDDWVTFRPGPCSADVLRPERGELS